MYSGHVIAIWPWPLNSPAASNSITVGRAIVPAYRSFGWVRKKSCGVSFISSRTSGLNRSTAPMIARYSACV